MSQTQTIERGDFSRFYDPNGKIRLGIVRSNLLSQSDQEPDLDTLRSLYRSWRDDVEGLVMQKQVWHRDGSCDHSTFWFKCAKRGNDVYTRRSERRLSALELPGEMDVTFWPATKARAKARFLFFTLTTAVKVAPLVEAWTKNVAQNWNRWITRLRKQYGRISTFRVWESTKKGYPHVHAMLEFHDREFEVQRHISDEGAMTWRVSNEQRDDFRKSWPAFIDVRAPQSYSRIIAYMRKRILKGTDKTATPEAFDKVEDAGDLTFSLMWLFRKRSFALSRDILKRVQAVLASRSSEFIGALRNSNPDGVQDIVIWVVLGVFSMEEVKVDSSAWRHEIDWVELGLQPRMSKEYFARVDERMRVLARGIQE